jgi:response regulator RpfG family c-di-GMP phosphodiesterase
MQDYSSDSPATAATMEVEAIPKILTIDDDPNVSQALQRLFHAYRVELLQAYHGMHGVWMATNELPDVIITDLRMPQGQGQNVVEFLKQNPKTANIPIIVLTGLRDAELESYMWKLGISEYLTKPVDFKQLRTVVERFVHVRRRKSEP